MSTDKMDVNIIPEFPIPKTTFSGGHSFGGVVDLLLTKLPSREVRDYYRAKSARFDGWRKVGTTAQTTGSGKIPKISLQKYLALQEMHVKCTCETCVKKISDNHNKDSEIISTCTKI
jgi:hypothetical protein